MPEPAAPIQVMIVDDHDMLREGLGSFLLAIPDLELVGEASGGAEAIQLCKELQPDVVLMDLVMPEVSGIEAISAIHQHNPEIRVLALSSFSEDRLVRSALQAGACGYLLKNISADKLAESIRMAAGGLSVIASEVTSSLVGQGGSTAGPNLTDREQQVLRLIVAGDSNNQIAHKLGISEATVKTYVRNILSKLNVASRTEAASYALRYHLLD
jgi:two-component system, NarL family, response regulator LiaR